LTAWLWIVVALAIVVVGLILYWLLVITEGTYLGQPIVTWLYDITARRYDNIKQYDSNIESDFLGEPLVTALRDEPSPLILDVGTGTGRLPLTVFEQPGFQGRIIAIDHSRTMLRIAAGKLQPYASRLTLIWQDAMRLPFLDNTFDAVTCMEVLEFTPDPEQVLREAVRVLRPGGLLLTTRRSGFDAKLIPGKTYSHDAFVVLLTTLGLIEVRLGRWQMDYDLAWGMLPGRGERGPRSPLEILHCPACGTTSWRDEAETLHCENCGSSYPVQYSIIELIH
jgi:ubiquinone/menaquinone biosynthesis C-methylase UbiE